MQTVTYHSIGTEAASNVAKAALEHGRTLGVAVSVAVVDRGGNLLAVLRDNAASFHSAQIAVDKAYTAVSFKAPTGVLGDVLHGMGPTVFHGLLERPGMAAFGGGLPVKADGHIVGGVGVSGGSAEQDEDCARVGLAVLAL